MLSMEVAVLMNVSSRRWAVLPVKAALIESDRLPTVPATCSPGDRALHGGGYLDGLKTTPSGEALDGPSAAVRTTRILTGIGGRQQG